MTKIETHIKFPCGYEFHSIVKIGFWVSEYGGQGYPNTCPIHGDKCKQLTKSRENK